MNSTREWLVLSGHHSFICRPRNSRRFESAQPSARPRSTISFVAAHLSCGRWLVLPRISSYSLLTVTLLVQAQPLVDRELDAELDALEHIRSSFTSNGHVVQASGATRRSSPPTFANSSSMLLPGQKSHYPSPLTGQPERPSAAKRRRLTLNAVTGATGTIVSSHDRHESCRRAWFHTCPHLAICH